MTVDKIVSDPNLAAVLHVSDQARDQAHGLLQLVAQAGDGGGARTENQVEIAKQQKRLLTSISHLRGLQRNASFAARDTKTQTAERRQEVDRLHLQLQNLYYEQRHLQGEIVACESYEYVMDSASCGRRCAQAKMDESEANSCQPQISAAAPHPC